MFINLEGIMKKVFVIIAILSVFMWLASCSESKKVEIDDALANDNSTVDDSNTQADDEETNEEDVTQDNTIIPDETVEPDNNVTPDETVIHDDETVDNIEEIDEDETLDGEETTDADTTKPEPPSCPENTFGLTIRTTYNNGTENVDGGGVVNRNPAGTPTIDEKTTCYAKDTVVTLTVVPDTNFVFSSWKGKGVAKLTGEFPTFSITMTETTTLRAEFAAE
jgi:FtsZ-interacting cell division protein ZipA